MRETRALYLPCAFLAFSKVVMMDLENASGGPAACVSRMGRNRLALAVAAAVMGMLAGASGAHAQFSGVPDNNGFLNNTQFFDWQNTTSTGNPNYIPAPFLGNDAASIAEADAYFAVAVAAGRPLAVKVTAPLSNPAAVALLDKYPINFVFGDIEQSGHNNASGPSAGLDDQYLQLVTQVKGSAKSSGALVSGFPYAPINTDQTSPQPTHGPNAGNFSRSGLGVASEALYPGDASFKVPSQLGGTSTAPNIRSNLFTLPLTRFSNSSVNIAPGMAHIPYISRFNNFNNPAFANAGQTPGGVNQFNTIDLGPAQHQLLSRDDFAALVLHYRMRGATSFHLLDPGVQGYTVAQMEADAQSGWLLPAVQTYFADPTAKPLTLSTTINTDGSAKTLENAGVVYSGLMTGIVNGIVSPDAAIALLISNLDDVNHSVSFPGGIAMGTIPGSYDILAHSHELLQFTRSGSMWQLNSNTAVFNDPTLASSDGVGVPEPASIGLLGIVCFGVLLRHRRS